MGTHNFEDLAKYFINTYGDEILSILVYGSRITNPSRVDEFSDFDVTVVFRDYPKKEIKPLPLQFDVSTYIWKDIEVLGLSSFYLARKGPHSIYYLASASVLYGTNPFLNLISQLDKNVIDESLLQQVISHCWRLGHMAIYGGDKKNRDIIKYSFRIAGNLYCLIEGEQEGFLFTPYTDWIEKLSGCNALKGYPMEYLEMICKTDRILIADVFSYLQIIKKLVVKLTRQQI